MTASADLTELDGMFRSGGSEARLAAIELALTKRSEWDKRWGGLFLRWARSPDSSDAVTDRLGTELIGPLWLSGEIEARQMVALSLMPTLPAWRSGLAALGPSLARDASDWPLFEQFVKACLDEDSRFHTESSAFKAVRRALRAGLKGCGDQVVSWVDRHEPELPGFVVAAVRAKTGRALEELES